ncbi:MAG: phosphoadenosine phosphosulfate reductase family protein [Desulfurococcales archaeon]|nr:phosphoadenosine phosphosulfate reductase family protein [Desulfurococcales archaeon]
MGRSRRRLADAWPLIAKLYWCLEKNTPMLGPECPGGGKAKLLRLTPPADARPAFSHDIKVIKEAYFNETGDRAGVQGLLGSGILLLNKVPFMDLMYEVVSRGVVVARVYWDPAESRWRLRFTLEGLLRVWDREPLPTFTVRGGLRTLRRTRVFRNGQGLTPRSQVALVDDEGNPVGIAYVSDDGEVLKVHSIFKGGPEEEAGNTNSTLDDAVKLNDYYIYYYTARAEKFIHVMAEKLRKPILVSYSGGKDSLVALHLTLRLGYKPYLIFNDTGLELPETRESVKRIADEYGLELLVADAGDAFWRAVERVGPPGKDFRWCCKVTKLAPLARLLNEKFPEGALNVVGQRAYESLDRARSPRVWRNRWIPHILNIAPIHEWSQLHVWLYIWANKLPYNPLYEKGFDRIGCFMCPAAYTAEYEFVKRTHPELWERWERILRLWASRIGLKSRAAEAWVSKGLWRWLTPAAQKQRLARRLGLSLPEWSDTYRRWLEPTIIEFKSEENGYRVKLSDPGFSVEWALDQYSVLGAFEPSGASNGRVRLEAAGGKVSVEVSDKEIRVSGARGILGRELLLDSLKLAFRWSNCAGCRACETSCPTGAIRVVEVGDRFIPRVDASRCIHCKLCLDNCPLADVVAEKVYSALALGDPLAWRRSGRRTHESVVERYLKLKGFKISESSARIVSIDTLVEPAALSLEEGES